MLLIERLKICQCEIFSSKFVRLPTAILISPLLAQSLLDIHLLTVHRILRLGEKAPQGQVGVLTRVVALDVVRVVVLHGGRGGSTSQHPTTRSTANAPNARTIGELRRLSFYTKGEFTDIANNDDCNPVSFVEYAYAVKTTQLTVARNFPEAMKMSDADFLREAAEKEIKSLQDLNVYKLVPRSTVLPGQTVIGTKWVFRVKANQTSKALLVAQG